MDYQRPAAQDGRAERGVDPDLFPGADRAARHRSDPHAAFLRLLDYLSGASADLLALAVPVDCVCCGAEDRELCAACERRIRGLTRAPFRAESGAPALMDVAGTVLLPVVAAGVYREELAQAVLSFKKHGQYQLQASLGRALAGAVRAAAGTPQPALPAPVLVPVPSSSAAYLKRGFSPVHLLLRRAAPLLAGLAVEDLLARKLSTAAGKPGLDLLPGGQKGLDRGGRARRVRGSMRVRPRLVNKAKGRRCVIVDDVLTTGATLAEAARALHLAGATVTGAVVLAATRPPDSTASGGASPEDARRGP